VAKIDDGLTEQERDVRRTALLLLHVYTKTKRRKKRRFELTSLHPHPTDAEGHLALELYGILNTMEGLERRMLFGDNNNRARMLSVWWMEQKKLRRTKECKAKAAQDKKTLISRALSKLNAAEIKALGYGVQSEKS
jgi:hypothetical protein